MTYNLAVGMPAPNFSLPNQDGKMTNLTDFLGKKLVLYFYPKDNTPVCTTQSCNLKDHHILLQEKGFQIVGISADNEASHLKFIQKYQLPFPLLADTEKTTLKAYDVWQKKNFIGKSYYGIKRTTFVISKEGLIEHIFTTINIRNHSQQILDAYNL